MVVSTVYATLGVDAVKEAVNEGKASMVLCNRVSVPLIGKIVSEMPTLKVILLSFSPVHPSESPFLPFPILGSTAPDPSFNQSPCTMLIQSDRSSDASLRTRARLAPAVGPPRWSALGTVHRKNDDDG